MKKTIKKNIKKKSKGFTLIELLAVIVILGILIAISVPAISSIINNSRTNTFKSAVESAIKAVATDVEISNPNGGTYYIDADGNLKAPAETVNELEANILTKPMKNSPFGGTWSQSSYIRVANGNYEICFDDGKKVLFATTEDISDAVLSDYNSTNACSGFVPSTGYSTLEVTVDGVSGVAITAITSAEAGGLIENGGNYTWNVPSKIDGKDVVKLGNGRSFIETDATTINGNFVNIIMNDNIIEIGNSALSGSGNSKFKTISNVTFSSNLKSIGSSVFYQDSLTVVTIPASVDNIGTGAFAARDDSNQILTKIIYKGSSTTIPWDRVLRGSGGAADTGYSVSNDCIYYYSYSRQTPPFTLNVPIVNSESATCS